MIIILDQLRVVTLRSLKLFQRLIGQNSHTALFHRINSLIPGRSGRPPGVQLRIPQPVMVDRQIKIILDIRGHIVSDKPIDISIDPGLHYRRVDASDLCDLWGSLFVGGLWFTGDLWGSLPAMFAGDLWGGLWGGLLTSRLPCSPGLAAASGYCTGSQHAHT